MRDPHALLAMSDAFANLNVAVSTDFADLSWIPTDFAFGSGDALAGSSMPCYDDESMPYYVDESMPYYVDESMPHHVDESMLMGGLPDAAVASAEMAPRKLPCPAPISAKLG
jgi:hypothetical protein